MRGKLLLALALSGCGGITPSTRGEMVSDHAINRGSGIVVLPFKNAVWKTQEVANSGPDVTQSWMNALPQFGLNARLYSGSDATHSAHVTDEKAAQIARAEGAAYALYGVVEEYENAVPFGGGGGDFLKFRAVIVSAESGQRVWFGSDSGLGSRFGSPSRLSADMISQLMATVRIAQ